MSKPKKKQQAARPGGSLRHSTVLGLTVLFLFWAPFQRALFNGNDYTFERYAYYAFLWGGFLLLGTSLFLLKRWKLKQESDALSIAIWLLPITYAISSIGAASHLTATISLYGQFLCVALFLIGLYLLRDEPGNRVLRIALLASGYCIVAFGLLHWLGNGKLAGALVGWFSVFVQKGGYVSAVMIDTNGPRLTSVFQYANTYASYLIALLLCTLFYVVKSDKWQRTVVYGIWIVPILISFWLTLSRGAIVVIGAVALAVLIFQKPYRQILMLLHLAIGLALSLAILSRVSNYGVAIKNGTASGPSGRGWLLLLGATAVYTAIAFLLQRYVRPWLEVRLERLSRFKFSYAYIPLAAVVLGGIALAILTQATAIREMLPANVATRLENINLEQHSVLERESFNKDAMKLIGAHPLIGAGGGAWATLYQKYQSYPYISQQAHNFYLQYLTEVGWIGFLILIALLIAVFVFYIRSFIRSDDDQRDSRFIYMIIALTLLTHSALDFDLSYFYLLGLLFLCLGAMASGSKLTAFNVRINAPLHAIYPIAVGAVSIVFLIFASRLVIANASFAHYQSIQKSTNSFEALIGPLDKSLKYQPGHPEYTAYSVDLLNQAYKQTKDEAFKQKEQKRLKTALRKEPYNRTLVERRIQDAIDAGTPDKALEQAHRDLANFIWDITLYQQAIGLEYGLMSQAAKSGDTEAQTRYSQQMLEDYGQIEANIAKLAELPKEQNQGRAFAVTPDIAVALGVNYYTNGKPADADAMLQPFISEAPQDSIGTTIDRYYLAALQKQGQNDPKLYETFVAAHPDEKAAIDQLVQTN